MVVVVESAGQHGRVITVDAAMRRIMTVMLKWTCRFDYRQRLYEAHTLFTQPPDRQQLWWHSAAV